MSREAGLSAGACYHVSLGGHEGPGLCVVLGGNERGEGDREDRQLGETGQGRGWATCWFKCWRKCWRLGSISGGRNVGTADRGEQIHGPRATCASRSRAHPLYPVTGGGRILPTGRGETRCSRGLDAVPSSLTAPCPTPTPSLTHHLHQTKAPNSQGRSILEPRATTHPAQ